MLGLWLVKWLRRGIGGKIVRRSGGSIDWNLGNPRRPKVENNSSAQLPLHHPPIFPANMADAKNVTVPVPEGDAQQNLLLDEVTGERVSKTER